MNRMRKNTLVYIAGPLTAYLADGVAHSVEQNVAESVKVYMALLQKGIPAFCPHLTAAYPSAWTLFDYDFWLAYDFAVIDRCTHMLMMPGYRESKGARREFEYAHNIRKIPVALTVAELEELLVINEAEPSV